MGLLDDLARAIFGGGQPERRFEDGTSGIQREAPEYGNVRFEDGTDGLRRPGGFPAQGLRTREQIQQAPFRMYEDQTFQGNPQAFAQNNPALRFYEDNSFGPAPYQNPIMGATNVTEQLQRNRTPYSPGEGPYIPRF